MLLLLVRMLHAQLMLLRVVVVVFDLVVDVVLAVVVAVVVVVFKDVVDAVALFSLHNDVDDENDGEGDDVVAERDYDD